MDLLEIYIRRTLRQTDFIYNDITVNIDYDGQEYHYRPEHLRIDFDSQDDPNIDNENRLLLELFNKKFKGFRVVLKSCKGNIVAIIVSAHNYDTHNYQNLSGHTCFTNIPPPLNEEYPYILRIDNLTLFGTVGIIRFLIEKIKELHTHRINLVVPYESKDEAKSLGAIWDVVDRLWFIPVKCNKSNRMLLLDNFEIKILQ